MVNYRKRSLEWFEHMRDCLEAAEKAGDIRKAYTFCASLSGALAVATTLYLIYPKDVRYWTDYMTAKNAKLEDSLFGPNLEEGRAS